MNFENLTYICITRFVATASHLIAMFFSTVSEKRVDKGNVRGNLLLKVVNIYPISGPTRLKYNIN